MKNRFDRGFEETKQNKVPKYGIRKLKVGVVSCLLAFSMFAPAVGAHAEKVVGKPVHQNIEVPDESDVELYESTNEELGKIADDITKLIEGIQQLEANLKAADDAANDAEKAEIEAKKTATEKKAAYAQKVKEYETACVNYDHRQKEKEKADKDLERAEKDFAKKEAEYKALKDAADTAKADVKHATEEQKKKVKQTKDALDDAIKKQSELLARKKCTYKDYKEVPETDKVVADKVNKAEEANGDVGSLIKQKKDAIAYDKNDNDKVKEEKERLDAALKEANKNDTLTGNKAAKLEADGDNPGCVKINYPENFEGKKDGLNQEVVTINNLIKAERSAVDHCKEVEKKRAEVLEKAQKDRLEELKKIHPATENEKETAAKEVENKRVAYLNAQAVVTVADSNENSLEKKLSKLEQKRDDAEAKRDAAQTADEVASDNSDAAKDKKEAAKIAKDTAEQEKKDAITKVRDTHNAFRQAKANLRTTRRVTEKGYGDLDVAPAGVKDNEKRGLKGLREDVAKKLKTAEEAYSKVKGNVEKKENAIKLLQELVASTKKFAAMSGDTNASDKFEEVLDDYNTKIGDLTDQVADEKEKLAESTALITVIRQLAEKAKVLKPRNFKPEGWNQEGTDWTYTDSNGMTVKDDWVQGKNGDWFYLDGFGKMAHDKWVEVNKKWFYAGSNGVIAQEQWIQNKLGDWFYVKKGGYMAQNEWVQVKGQWYYAQKDGNMAKNVTLNVNGVNYSFNANCAWVK